MHEYKNSLKHERTHTLLVHNEQGAGDVVPATQVAAV